MAVVAMKKFFCLAHQTSKTRLLDALQEHGHAHIEDLREKAAETEVEPYLTEPLIDTKDLHLVFSKVQFILGFFKPFEPKKGLLSSMIKEKVRTTRDRFSRIDRKIKLDDIYEKCEDLDSELTGLASRQHHLESLRLNLLPWFSLDAKISELKGTLGSGLLVGSLPHESLISLQEELEANYPQTDLEIVSIDRGEGNICVIFHRELESEIQTVLNRLNFRMASWLDLRDTPAAEIKRIEDALPKIEAEREEKFAAVQKLLYLKDDLRILHEYLDNKIKKLEVEEQFAQTREAFMIEGWVPAEEADRLEQVLKEVAKEIDLTFLEPDEEDKPPITLRNNPIIQPFETLTRLFGMPDYNELDPTPYLAPFFFLFFGICLGDVVYGLILTLACFWMMKKLDVSENVKKGMMLFAYGGIASIIIGVLTGSYAGLDAKYLPAFLKSLVVIWPLNNLTLFLLMTIALGIIQVSFGIVLAAVNNIRNGSLADAIYDQLTTLLFLWAAIAALTAALAGIMTKPTPAWVKMLTPPSLVALAVTILTIIYFHGRYFNKLFEVIKELIQLFRQGDSMDGIKNALGTVISLVFTVSVVGWVATFFVLGSMHTGFGQLILISFLLSLVFKPSRQLLVKFFAGLYSLYNMSGYIGNFLSYVRLLALGLATSLIAGALNLLVEIAMPKSLEFSVKGFAALLLLVGVVLFVVFFHLVVNLGMGLIGTFVHPARLQFVEFFGQFYSDGGRKYKPFGIQTKYLIFEE